MSNKIDLTKSKERRQLKVLIKRAIWTYFLQPSVFFLPKPFSFLRIWFLRFMGAKIGNKCLILPKVRVLMPWNLVMKDCVAIGEGVNLYNFSLIDVGSMTVISQNSMLCTGSHDYKKNDMPLISSPIVIGQECWIAAEVFVCPGVVIHDGIVVGARSVVTKSLLYSWSLYAGNPCRFVEKRVMN
jgi:putative colanic acid biosynthesis acetyltransferase WcaF